MLLKGSVRLSSSRLSVFALKLDDYWLRVYIICGPVALAEIRRIVLTTSTTAEVRSPPFLALWLRTMRIPFLQATFVPVVLGGVIAFQVAHFFNLGTFLLTILGARLTQI